MDAMARSIVLSLLDNLRDRARLVVHQAPVVADAPKMVGRSQCRAVDDLDAEHARAVAIDDGLRFRAHDLRPFRALQDIAPASDHRGPADDGRPAGMNAGNGVI